MRINPNRYSTSFTTGSLFRQESVKLAALYLEAQDWKTVRNRVIADNLLQARKLSSSQRICSEVISRLKKLSYNELKLLIGSSSKDQAYLLWLALCRRYNLIEEFAFEVLHERYVSRKHDLKKEDFDCFLNRKSEWHPELEQIKPTTKTKLCCSLFKILREADLLAADNTINTALLNRAIIESIRSNSPNDILLFPVFESNLQQVVK
jgi:hypothetical protein